VVVNILNVLENELTLLLTMMFVVVLCSDIS